MGGKNILKLVGEVLKNSTIGTATFVVGFIIGTIVDMGFFTLYMRWDPEEKSIWKLTPIVLAQIFVLMLMLASLHKIKEFEHMQGTISKLGLIVSQIFMLEYAVVRYGELIYDRSLSARRKKKASELVENWWKR
jgi:ABC-type transport system involved in cytochrome c biogenesis permease subunit